MATYQVHLTISSAKNLKNVNWRNGDLKPYVVAWVDSTNKTSSKVAEEGDTKPKWDETLFIPFTTPIIDSTLAVDIVHAYADHNTKPLVGKARVLLQDIIDEVGFEEWTRTKLKLKRPSGRPQGKLRVEVKVLKPDPYHAPPSYGYGAPVPNPYGAPPAPSPYGAPAPYGSGSTGYPYNPPVEPGYGEPVYGGSGSTGYPYNPPIQPGYGGPVYGGYGSSGYPSNPPGYGGSGYGVAPTKEKSGFGVGAGLAMGVVAGALGALAIHEGIEHLEDKIADDVEERVREDFGCEDSGCDDF